MDQLTICIPRVETHITKEYISKKFDKLKLGDILQITDVPLKWIAIINAYLLK